jgi:hypothetical protein
MDYMIHCDPTTAYFNLPMNYCHVISQIELSFSPSNQEVISLLYVLTHHVLLPGNALV